MQLTVVINDITRTDVYQVLWKTVSCLRKYM